MRVFAIRRDDQVTVILGAKHYKRSGDAGLALYAAAQQYRATKSEEDLDALLDLVNPYQKYVRQGVLREGEGHLYLGETQIPLPAALADTITDYLDNGFPIEPLVNFWHWCLLNPNTTARDRFFEYCQNYGVTITDTGMAVLYKAVTQKEDNRAFDLAHFVATEWLQVRRRNENPADYHVFQNSGGFRAMIPVISDTNPAPAAGSLGTLDALFNSIHNQNLEGRTVYTDKHSRTMDIKLGVPVYKPREQCDPNIHNECSYGLHVGSFRYVSAFGNGNDTVFACLVNPMNVVALPNYDNSKIRVCEYYPYAVMNRKDQDWEELPSSFFEGEYTPYSTRALLAIQADLDEKLKDVNMDTEAFKLVKQQQTIVRTKLQDIYENQPDAVAADVEEPVEAPFEETYFDVNDPWAENQIRREPAEAIRNANEESLRAWREAVTAGQTQLSFADWMDEEEDDDDLCLECGCYLEDCECDEEDDTDQYGREIVSREEAIQIWKDYIASGGTRGLAQYWEDADEDLDSEKVFPDYYDL